MVSPCTPTPTTRYEDELAGRERERERAPDARQRKRGELVCWMRLLLPLLLAMEHPAWLAEKIASGCIIQKEVKFKGGSATKIIT